MKHWIFVWHPTPWLRTVADCQIYDQYILEGGKGKEWIWLDGSHTLELKIQRANAPYQLYDPCSVLQWVFQFLKEKRQTVIVTFEWIGDSCFTVKVKDVADVDIEAGKRRLRERCLPWNYPAVLVAHDNAFKIEKPQLSLVGRKGEGWCKCKFSTYWLSKQVIPISNLL